MTLTDASVGKVTVQIGPTLRGTQLRDGYSGASYQDFNDRCCSASTARISTVRRSK
nr:Predicted periplasmic lipoprotein [Klebsiella pneumoniae]